MIENLPVLRRIERIDWFAECGAEVKGLDIAFDTVRTWKQAERSCKKRSWDNAQIEYRNQLTEYLFDNCRARLNAEWNPAVREAKAFLSESVTPKLTALQASIGFPQAVIDGVHWDAVAAIMEAYYEFSGHDAWFATKLLGIYELGHFPCGWTCGVWPVGRLVIF